ncbi:unnamed protein product [Fraxinus pennsylvanica]|uniref:Uncharacterized protein n=1 Tax=Fraxinus pennsylvanica TaxID=56036 RepID=A0AAD2ECN7_9LAMI|nr:unnamed protein product [Fraxinus pennsylvanica]
MFRENAVLLNISQNPDCTFFVLSFAASDKSKVQRNKLKTSGEKIDYKCQVRATDGKKAISTIVSILAFIFLRLAEVDWFVKLYFPTLGFFQPASIHASMSPSSGRRHGTPSIGRRHFSWNSLDGDITGLRH